MHSQFFKWFSIYMFIFSHLLFHVSAGWSWPVLSNIISQKNSTKEEFSVTNKVDLPYDGIASSITEQYTTQPQSTPSTLFSNTFSTTKLPPTTTISTTITSTTTPSTTTTPPTTTIPTIESTTLSTEVLENSPSSRDSKDEITKEMYEKESSTSTSTIETTPHSTTTTPSTITMSTTISTTTTKEVEDKIETSTLPTTEKETNVTIIAPKSFRDVGHDSDINLGPVESSSSSESDNYDNVSTFTPFQSNETANPTITTVDNSKSDSNETEKTLIDSKSPGEIITRGTAGPRNVADSDDDDSKYDAPLITDEENSPMENVTSKVNITITTTTQPMDSIDSVARRVNTNSANSIGSNQFLPILLFSLLITQLSF